MIVVTGATGNVGRPLVRALVAAGEKVRAVSRRPSGVPEGAEAVPGDLLHPGTLEPALAGAEALFLLTSAEVHGATAGLGDVLDVARLGGVRRVVLLSSIGVGTGRHPSGLEGSVTASELGWTLLRPGAFASNDLAWAEQVRTGRVVHAPFPDVALPVIDPADIADVAATALLDDGHEERTYELTGPAPVSPRQRVATIGAALGEEVRLVEQGRAEAKAQMLGAMPEPVVEATLGALGEPTPAERRVSPDVERVLGRAPRAYAEWVGRNVARFR